VVSVKSTRYAFVLLSLSLSNKSQKSKTKKFLITSIHTQSQNKTTTSLCLELEAIHCVEYWAVLCHNLTAYFSCGIYNLLSHFYICPFYVLSLYFLKLFTFFCNFNLVFFPSLAIFFFFVLHLTLTSWVVASVLESKLKALHVMVCMKYLLHVFFFIQIVFFFIFYSILFI